MTGSSKKQAESHLDGADNALTAVWLLEVASPLTGAIEPASDPALASWRAEIWGHFHDHPQGRSPRGYFASRLSFPLANDWRGWSEKGVQVDYGDDFTTADLEGYADILDVIAGLCRVIEGPLVLSL